MFIWPVQQSDEAKKFPLSSGEPSYKLRQPGEVEARARAEVVLLGGNPSDHTDLRSQFEVQFGQFKGRHSGGFLRTVSGTQHGL